MIVATWNVNSIRAREARLFAWLDQHRPDVVCLQELKATVDKLPLEALRERGYHVAANGQPTYNGVAILAREPLADVKVGLGDVAEDPQARLVAATVAGVRILSCYVPNGADVGSDKWRYKLVWLERLQKHLATAYRSTDALVLCGDFNVAPTDHDVARPEEWRDTVLCHDDARAALARVTETLALVDTFRQHHAGGGHYSWWDYRNLGFPKGNGLRIDLVFATASLAARCTAASIDRDERKGEGAGKGASDHAPVLATFA